MNKFLTLLVALSLTQVVSAQRFTTICVNGVELNCKVSSRKNSEVSILSLKNLNNQRSLIIPDRLTFEDKNYDVTSIGYNAFANLEEVDSLIIQNGRISIQDGSFINSSINYADLTGVTYVLRKSFYNCSSLRSVYFSSNLIELGEEAFNECHNLIVYHSGTSYERHYRTFSKEYGVTYEDSKIIIDSIKYVDKFNYQEGGTYNCTIIDDIPNRSAEQIYNSVLAYLAKDHNITNANKDVRTIVTQDEKKKIHKETDVMFGRIYEFDLYCSIQVDCKDERIRIILSLTGYRVMDKNWAGRDVPTYKECGLLLYNDKPVHMVSCREMLKIADLITKAALEDGVDSGDDW